MPFVVRASDVPEDTLPSESPEAAVERLAVAKAAAVGATAAERFVIGADTVVVCDGDILGKPAGAAEARAMLRRLRGRGHTVTSGIAVLDRESGRQAAGSLTTTVWMRPYGDDEIEAYIASGDPFDKAGAYAIQDPGFRPVARIEGCYLCVVGLPLCLLTYLLWQAGVPVSPPDRAAVKPLCPNCVFSSR
jgi:MAF protein